MAIICLNDLMAFGMQNAAHELGLKIPSELSVMAYDDIDMSRQSYPSLMTIKILLDELATQALVGLDTKFKPRGHGGNIGQPQPCRSGF